MKYCHSGAVTPDLLSYMAVVVSAARSGNAQIASEWFDKMETSGLKPDLRLFTAVVSAFAKRGDQQTARVWYDKMIDAGFKPDHVSFSALFDGMNDSQQLHTDE